MGRKGRGQGERDWNRIHAEGQGWWGVALMKESITLAIISQSKWR